MTFGKNGNYASQLEQSKRDDRQVIFLPNNSREFESANKPMETKIGAEAIEESDLLNDILKYSDSELKSMEGYKLQPFDVQGDVIIDPSVLVNSAGLKKSKNLVFSNMQGNKTIYNGNSYEYVEPVPSSQALSSRPFN